MGSENQADGSYMTEGTTIPVDEPQSRSLAGHFISGVKRNWPPTLLIILILGAWGSAELQGVINIVSVNPPYTLGVLSDAFISILSLALTFIIALLYQNQMEIQKNQTRIRKSQKKLMEEEYRPLIRTEVEVLEGDDQIPVITILNTGREAAVKVTAEWTFAGIEESGSSPFLSSGRIYQYPLIIFDGGPLAISEVETILGPDKDIPRYLRFFENQDFDDKLTWEVNCEDIVGKDYHFEDSISVLDSFNRLEHTTTVSELELLQETNEQLEAIQRELRHSNSPMGTH